MYCEVQCTVFYIIMTMHVSFHLASTVSASSAATTPQSPPPTGKMSCLTQIV